MYLFNFFFLFAHKQVNTQDIERKWGDNAENEAEDGDEHQTENNWMLSIDGKILEIYNMVKHFTGIFFIATQQTAAFSHTHPDNYTLQSGYEICNRKQKTTTTATMTTTTMAAKQNAKQMK